MIEFNCSIKKVFCILLAFQILGEVLLLVNYWGYWTNPAIQVICFAIFFFISPFLLVLSINEFIKDKENIFIPLIAGIVSIIGIIIVVMTLIEVARIS